MAAGIQKHGGSSGLAFALLLCMPAVNFATLLVFARKSIFAAVNIALSVVLCALAISQLVDWYDLDMLVTKEAKSGAESLVNLPIWFIELSPTIVQVMAGTGVVLRLAKLVSPSSPKIKEA